MTSNRIAGATEVWLPISDYEGLYEVSNRGQVRSLDRRVRCVGNGMEATRVARGKLIRLVPTTTGYLRVHLRREGRGRTYNVHQLVLEAFAGPRPQGLVARHGPGGKLDNRWPENLCWGTQRENAGPDRERDGTAVFGSGSPSAKLTEAAVRECRARYAAGRVSYRLLAEQYAVSTMTIWNAVAATGHTWRRVS